MPGKGKRRSARLLKLEEQKNDGDSAIGLLDPWQIIRNSISGPSARGKRKRNGEIQDFQQLQGEASCSHQPLDAAHGDNLSSQSSVGQIIDYILDELELRDRHELFAMPDDIQVTDYAERVDRPSDLATLRQKNKDGMYKALVHFENDVCMVFQKAMSMNSQDTVPFREALSLLDQAKHVFLSLRHNQMYTESELAAWRQRHLVQQQQQPVTPARREGDNGGPSRQHPAAATLSPRPAAATPRKKQENARTGGGGNAPESQRAATTQRRGKESTGTPPGKNPRKAATAGVGGAGVARRRLTYTNGAGAGQGRRERDMAMAMPVFEGRHVITLLHPPQEHAYRDSLQGFVRHAGLKARVAAEFRTLECVARARHSPVPYYWNGGSFAPGAGAGAAGFLPAPPTTPPPGGATAPSSADRAPGTECKLETDEVLKLFVLMGTPAAFLDRAKQMFGGEKREESAKEGQATKAAADDATAAAAAATEPAHKSATDQPGHGSRGAGGGGEPAAAFGPFAPPKLVLPSRLGFGQFAGSSAQPFKVKKPSTPNASGKKKVS
ncbi:hypothetical protein ACP70R_014088 [Stipagrostis hirtigluma subsp. patula]